MDRTAIEKIVEVSEPHIIKEKGFTYTDKPLRVVEGPKVKPIILSTLSSLVNLLKKESNYFDSPVIVHIDSHCTVDVLSGIALSDRTRENPYNVSAITPEISFGRQMNYEQMMIALKSKFVDTEDLRELVQLLGTITQENNMQIADDGFTQSVTVRRGIAIKGNKAVNPIVKLQPYRTFLEVEQPESNFLIRLFDNAQVALFEADGGAWKLEARKNISEYLKNNLSELIKEGTVIIAE